MFACGHKTDSHEIQMYSAALPPGTHLSATGWSITPDENDADSPKLLAGKTRSYAWDGNGGRHCPSYVRGWDPEKLAWVERIYYAGAAQHFMGPYTIGYLEWDGAQWMDQPEPAFVAAEDWEHGSVYEPNLIYHDGKWRMWYVAGANQDDYIVQGYAESSDGRTNWSTRQIVFAAEERVFDFCVVAVEEGFEAVFSRVNLRNADLPKTGLWWCKSSDPSPNIADWSEPVRISEPGPWKPVLRYGENDPNKMFVFHDGVYLIPAGSGSPFSFTLHCREIERPA
jgi:hypothetical protein